RRVARGVQQRGDVGVDPGRRGSDGDGRPARGSARERDARAGHARLAPRAALLARVPRRRAGARPRAVLHLPVALRVLDARARPLPILRPDVRVLGVGGPVLLPPDRLLVRAAVRRACGREGLLDHQARRPRVRHRDRHALGRDGHLRVPRALREGAGATYASVLHLLTHGLFKALLFLGAGAVIHAVGTNDIFRMGGLFRAMPQTGVVFIVGTLALAGLPPLAGFFSKEAILAGVWE